MTLKPAEPSEHDKNLETVVSRFLAWKFPEDFSPDGGISFFSTGNTGTTHEYRMSPTGTNLLTAMQATLMLQQILGDLTLVAPETRPADPQTEVGPATSDGPNHDWHPTRALELALDLLSKNPVPTTADMAVTDAKKFLDFLRSKP